MNVEKELNLRLYIQREENILHSPYEDELKFYQAVKRGDLETIREKLFQDPLKHMQGLGLLSANPLRNVMYHYIVSVAMITRFCVEGGMDLETAYSLIDLYIQKGDQCIKMDDLLELHKAMILDFTKRMKNLRKQKIYSKHIVICIEYIYNHLHERIKVEELSELTKLNVNYLSKLFKKETGLAVSDYIRIKKIETAENLIKFSELSFAEITNCLAFSSQSHFIQVFQKKTGLTPREYRDHYFASNWKDDEGMET